MAPLKPRQMDCSYTGAESEHVCGIVECKHDWYDRNSIKHGLSDELLVRSLLYRLQGALWAVFVEELAHAGGSRGA